MIFSKLYKFLSSAKLAMGLLITILACCLIGVTLVRDVQAGALIFGALWFNLILILLVINVAFCFFGRIWGRKVTMISLGMILFHLSFVAMLGGIVYNSLFCFRGSIRVTEGESVPSGSPESYDYSEYGRFFNFAKLKGETTLIKMHTGYKADGADKRTAYEISVGEGVARKQGVIYVTKSMEHDGFSYYNDKEGYSIQIALEDKQGKDLYGAFIPFQSYLQSSSDNSRTFSYATGTKDGPGSFPYPQDPAKPQFSLQASFSPSKLTERSGEVMLQVWPLASPEVGKPIASGKVAVGGRLAAGEYMLSPKEVRYWVGMMVRHEPGKPVVLASLWVGFFGIIITFIGRIRKSTI